MFDHSMTMLFQMFRTMHAEHVGTLRNEIERLDELNRELQALVSLREKTDAEARTPSMPNRRLTADSQPASRDPSQQKSANERTRSAAGSDATLPVPARPASRTESKEALQSSPAAEQAEPDVHLWLCRRMEEIQHERQGLWDRIVGVLRKQD
jgi:hypothetical protein